MTEPLSTDSSDIDILYTPSGEMTDSDRAIVDDLVATIGDLGLSSTHHIGLRKSLELLSEISIVIADILMLLKFFGVSDYFKIRMQERAKVDAKLAAMKRTQAMSALSESPIIEKLSTYRKKGKALSIAIHTSEQLKDETSANHRGGLVIKGHTTKEISSEVEGYIHHAPALLNLISSEISLENTRGGIYTELLPNGDLEVQWVLRGSGGHIEKRVLHRDINS